MCNNLLIDTQNANWAKPKGRANQRPVLPVVLSLQGQWELAALECKVKPLMVSPWECGTRARGSLSTTVGHAKGPADASKILQHTVLLLSLLPLSFGLHPTPSLRFCVMGWQRMWLLPGCDPREWQISPPASKLRCSLQLMSLLSQQPFPHLCSFMTFIWSRYLFCFRLEWKKMC